MLLSGRFKHQTESEFLPHRKPWLPTALIIGFVLFSALNLSPTLNPQTLALYLGVFLGLACGGAGRISLDHLLAGRRARKRAV